MMTGYIVVGVLILLAIYFVGLYNGLIRARNQTKNGWAQIDVQLKRRHDLVPNLVKTVKAYATHERETLEEVVEPIPLPHREAAEQCVRELASAGLIHPLTETALR